MRRILIPVIDKEFELVPQFEKLEEEVKEVWEGIMSLYDGANIEEDGKLHEELASEVLDVIQVCVGLAEIIERQCKGSLEKAAEKHPAKLINYGFKFKKILRVDED
ncbi:hypothetical protein [Anaerosolibacter sp.]|uniref:hypothetical protein n=1 Tax=Anaerosolibacter sp. TaxID=1872527 RepID=UPI0039EDEF06